MDIGNIISFVLGLIGGLVAFALLLPSLNKRSHERHQAKVDSYEQVIADLRRERAEDRETNRRLRHELATNTPLNFETTREERDTAIEELEELHRELREANVELADRDRMLREARLAIHDIRVQLERDRYIAATGDKDSSGSDTAGDDQRDEDQLDSPQVDEAHA